MRETHFSFSYNISCILLIFQFIFSCVHFHASATDDSVMQDLKNSLNIPTSFGWSDPDVCKWRQVECSPDRQVTRIQIGEQGLTGSLPASLNQLASLEIFEVFRNQLSGPLPSFSGLSSLNRIMLNENNFSYIPPDFFNGLTSLESVYLEINPFSSWVFPESIKSASTLVTFSATSTNMTGTIPDFLCPENFPSLLTLHLAYNYLECSLPSSFPGFSIQSLWLNGQKSNSRLNGSIDFIGNMTSLTQVWLHGNSFTGPLPDFSGLTELTDLSLRDNQLTGPIPNSLVQLPSLRIVNLTNNYFQGPTPKFNTSVNVDMAGQNMFCSDQPGVPCDPLVTNLLAVAQGFGYPYQFASKWQEINPCEWPGVTCNSGNNITVLNFPNLNLSGVISPAFSAIGSLEKLILSNNNITGRIPDELTTLPNLQLLDVSNNQLYGTIPAFGESVLVKTDGNLGIGNDNPPPAPGTYASDVLW